MKISKSLTKNILAFFIVFNVLLFAKTIPHRVIGSPYPVGRMYMNAASTINFVYLKPAPFSIMASLFHNTLYAPLFIIRDFLYKQGLKYIPANDMEREVWYGKVKYFDYMFLHNKGDFSYDKNSISIIYTRKINNLTQTYGQRLHKLLEKRRENRHSLNKREVKIYYNYIFSLNQVKNEIIKLNAWQNVIEAHISACQAPNNMAKDPRMQIDLMLFLRELLSQYPHVIKKYLYVTEHNAVGSFYPADVYKIKGETEKFQQYYKILKKLKPSILAYFRKKYKSSNNEEIMNRMLVLDTDCWHYLDPIIYSQYQQKKLDCESEYYKDYISIYNSLNNILKNQKVYLEKANIDFTSDLKKVSDMDKNYKLFTAYCKK